MLDYDSEDINGMDDDAGDDQEPAPTGHWRTTPTHDVCMVDTPKGSDDEEQRGAAEDNPADKQQNGDADAALSPASTTTALLMTQQYSRANQRTTNIQPSNYPNRTNRIINPFMEQSTVRTHHRSIRTFTKDSSPLQEV